MTVYRDPWLTRRVLLALLGLSVTATAVPGSPRAVDHASTAEAEFRTALERMILPFSPYRLDLLDFVQGERGGLYTMRALVRLTWRPGLRQAYFTASGSDPRLIVDDLTAQVQANFGAAAGTPGRVKA
ncbi:MAG: hypothetical protein AAGF50_03485 [Pseudomonadota bacterium]